MVRRLIWTVEKVRGVPQKRAACWQCGWISEIRGIRGLTYERKSRGGIPANTGATRLEFLSHNCDEFPGGTRRWRIKRH